MKDYYQILGISPDSSDEVIKNRYRDLVKQYHPDINKNNPDASKKMSEINEAYETLSDPDKRQKYDTIRMGGMPGGFSSADFNSFDFSEGFGSIFEDFFDVFQGSRRTTKARSSFQRGADIEVQIEVNLKDVLSNINKSIQIERLETCEVCNGKGAKPGTSKTNCSACQGTGYSKVENRTPFGVIMRTTTCSKCNGEGQIIKDPCNYCKGSGTHYKKRQVSIEIPAGIEDGMRIKLSNEGHQGKYGGPKGDLFVRIKVKSEPGMIRQGKNIYNKIQIPYYLAILGGQIEVQTLDGLKPLLIHKGTQHQETYPLKGLGLPGVNDKRRGDFIVVIDVEIPKNISQNEEKYLKEIYNNAKQNKKSYWW